MSLVSPGRVVATLCVGAVLATTLAPAVARAQFRPPQTADAVVRTPLAELKKLVDADNVVVIDVRSPAEFAAAHIPGAINVPLETVPARAATFKDTTKLVVTYCA